MGSLSNLKINLPGVRSVLKQAGVKTLLDQQGAAACERANSMFSLSGLRGEPDTPPYAYEVVTRAYSAGAQVYAASYFGYLDNLNHNTLKKAANV